MTTRILTAVICALTVVATVNSATAAVTYVDADPNTNTAGPVSGDPAIDWWLRPGFANNSNVLQSGVAASAGIELTTSVAVPSGDYDVYAFFWASSNNVITDIRAGLTSGATPHFSQAAPTVLASAVSYDVPPLLTEADRTLYAVPLGQVSGTSIDVYVNSAFSENGGAATWYDGIGYAAVQTAPEPSTMILAIAGTIGLSFCRRRRNRG